MKSLRSRLAIWFGIVFVTVAAAFIYLLHLTLEQQLLEKACVKISAEEPDRIFHDSMIAAEIHQIANALMQEALLLLLPLSLIALAGGYWLARHSLRPIANVNRQLQAKHPGNLGQPISLPEVDLELRDLVRQLNDLLARLDGSFAEMNTYAAKVAHELRTPLTIMRLKVEQAGKKIAPELADDLEGELHRLTHIVDQSLLIARAEQGRLAATRSVFDFSASINEVVADFQLLAAEQGRHLTLQAETECWVTADPRHVRQIVHNLLTNALKHGGGDFTVRVKSHEKMVSLFVANRVQGVNIEKNTLGLGLRVVSVLLRLEPGMRLQERRGPDYHLARLLLPCVRQPLFPAASVGH
jgi:signal transduction histidine kinase